MIHVLMAIRPAKLKTFTLCLDSKLGEKCKEEKGKGRAGIKRESTPCLFRSEGKEKERKMSVFLQIFSLQEI